MTDSLIVSLGNFFCHQMRFWGSEYTLTNPLQPHDDQASLQRSQEKQTCTNKLTDSTEKNHTKKLTPGSVTLYDV